MAKKNYLNPKIDKKAFKKSQNKCRICGEEDYALLDVHRILEGKNGGKYLRYNSVSLCANCHRRVHDGQIVIDKYYLSTSGEHVLRIIENGEEKFV
jgi:hypothetical protein